MSFSDRIEAGSALAKELRGFDPSTTLICGIPRGGAVVAAEAAHATGLPYECVVVCKIGMPCFPEVTLGAIDQDGEVLFDPSTQLTRVEMARVGDPLMRRIESRVSMCRGDRAEADFNGKTVIVVDEYVADPIVALKALGFLRNRGAERAVLATPVGTHKALDKLREEFDQVIAVHEREVLGRVSDVYDDATQPDDEQISHHLQRAWAASS